jgi:hypothetical protein
MPDLPGDTLVKPFKVLQVIRKIARNCLFDADDWDEYYRGLLLYLLGALKFNDLYDPPLAPLPSQVAVWGAAAVQQLLEEPQTDQGRRAKNGPDAFNVLSADLALDIEPPFGTMPADSRFYIERAADDECWRHIASPYAVTLFVQAPMQTGKSSLIRRMLHRAETRLHIQSAYIDFQGFTEQYLADEESFFIGLCLMIGDALGVSEAVDSYWEGRRTNIMKCSRYLSEHIMPTIKRSFILAMDEVERMLDCPFRANFFGMLRTWHNNRVDDDGFGQMTLFLSSSTDSYLLIDKPHQSPFNVATPIRLQDFTIDEVHELNSRHNSPLDRAQVQELVDLLNGHPFLTRLALYQVALHRIDLRTLLARAAEPGGPFGDHLRHYWRQVEQQPELRQALTQICNTHTHSENPVLHRLVAAGLVTKVGDQVSWRNRLYDRYFKERLNG